MEYIKSKQVVKYADEDFTSYVWMI